MKIAAAGDAIIGRIIPKSFEGYGDIAPYIKAADAAFFNLETTLNEVGDCPAAETSGGTYLRVSPRVLPSLEEFGFNMTTFNNNHAFDFSVEGFKATLESLNASSFVHAGCGRNLAEASAPRYLDTAAGRVALIAVNASFTVDTLAGEQTATVPGRPGINGLRLDKYVTLPKEELALIRKIGEASGINAEKQITIAEGYFPAPKESEAMLGELKFIAGDECKYVMKCNRTDVERIKRAIYEAELQADYIMVSIHSHQLSGDKKEYPAEFFRELSHELIDAGAHAIIGHGPHLLRPIEVYKNRPIFYSLGDFILELYNVETAPAEFFEKHGVRGDATVRELLETRSAGFTRGLMCDERMFLSVVPLWEVDGGEMKSLRLLPIMGIMDGNHSEIGLPRVCDPERVVKYLGEMSEPYGVRLSAAEDGLIDVSW